MIKRNETKSELQSNLTRQDGFDTKNEHELRLDEEMNEREDGIEVQNLYGSQL